jgi:hypothetical protein
VGKVGVAISHIGDMRTLFEGIPLASMNTSMTINARSRMAGVSTEDPGLIAARRRRWSVRLRHGSLALGARRPASRLARSPNKLCKAQLQKILWDATALLETAPPQADEIRRAW